MRVRGVVIERFGGVEALRVVDDLPVPEVGPDEVRIRVRAAGLNPRDLLQREGDLGGVPPLIPGAEVSGVVDEVGSAVTEWAPRDEVFARVDGAYAEYVVTSRERVFAKPRSLDHDQAVGIVIAWGTAAHGLFTLAGLAPDEVLLVRGASTATGLAAIQLAAMHGCRVLAVIRNEERAGLVRDYGADEVIVASDAEFAPAVAELAPGGVHVAFDGVGGPGTRETLATMAACGRYLLYGYLGGFDAFIHVPDLVRSSVSLIGFSLSRDPRSAVTFERIRQELLPAFEDGRLKPLPVRRLRLEDVEEGHRLLARGGVAGKIALWIGPDGQAGGTS